MGKCLERLACWSPASPFLVPWYDCDTHIFYILAKQIAIGGLRSKDYFDRYGDLKRIRRLKYCTLERLLVDKFKLSSIDARELAEFLCPILDFVPDKRPTAQQCLLHPWLNTKNPNTESGVEKANV